MQVSDLNKLLKMHRQMSDMMKKIGKGKGGMLKQAMKGMFGKGGMPDIGGMDQVQLEAAAKQMGGGMNLPPRPERFWQKEMKINPLNAVMIKIIRLLLNRSPFNSKG